MSSANSKSNEMEQSQAHVTHNNLPLTIGNKFRNQINQNTPPDVLNVNQQRYYHDVLDNFSSNTNYNNLKIGGCVGVSAVAGAGGAVAVAGSSASSSSSTLNSVPTAGVTSIFGASTSSAQGTSLANSSVTGNTNSESNILNSIVNNNSNTNNENR